jgi:hypothetical protein
VLSVCIRFVRLLQRLCTYTFTACAWGAHVHTLSIGGAAGKRVISYEPVKPVDALRTAKGSTCACPMCSCRGEQLCSNCLGEGIIYPAQGPRHRAAQMQTFLQQAV